MAQNGSADASINASSSSLPTVVGINYGNSYASIAVVSKEGLADCIANEDGERQIASAISFHGEETYIGAGAKHQLVKNAENTIIGFRNLLGRKFSEIPKDRPLVSAPVIQHPENQDEPAYKVTILQPAPKPLPTPSVTSSANTPLASKLGTPRSEPTQVERYLTVSEVNTIFIKSLIQSAEDFLGKKVEGVVIAVPSWFEEVQREALIKAAEDAGVKVLQLIDDIAAAALQSITTPASSDVKEDRTQLVIDLGSSSLSLAILSIRQGLIYPLASSSDPAIGADLIDDKLIKFFAKDFTKKTKIPLSLPVTTSSSAADKRAEAKLRLAIEHTKRTISASPGAATCSVESLKDGYDLSGTINRMRFDMEAREVYTKIAESAKNLVADAGLDLYDIDEIVYAGGTGCLPGLDQTVLDVGFNETVITPFSTGAAVGGGASDPTTILAKGAVVQAKLLAEIAGDQDLLPAFETATDHTKVKATSRTLGLIFPEEATEESSLGGQWIPVILKETALPARRICAFDVDLGKNNSGKVGFEVWEVKESIKVELVKGPPPEGGDEDEEEEPEENEEKEKLIEKDGAALTSIIVPINNGKKEKGRWKTKVSVQLVADEGGKVEITAWEVDGGEKVHKIIQT
ncbi:actin-like ATPase domain-containing protein [Thelephora terrestris]|uniref:Actin-like ATPase domain-containing protein n=1 Tax=Thelephora terrestris TaxID=56493 RepID=A0A9P6H3M1_9AGAM|nr:actin-like ATPase domain-containing protein [Thelephora terrestris]